MPINFDENYFGEFNVRDDTEFSSQQSGGPNGASQGPQVVDKFETRMVDGQAVAGVATYVKAPKPGGGFTETLVGFKARKINGAPIRDRDAKEDIGDAAMKLARQAAKRTADEMADKIGKLDNDLQAMKPGNEPGFIRAGQGIQVTSVPGGYEVSAVQPPMTDSGAGEPLSGVRVGPRLFPMAMWTGTPSGYLKVFMDGETPPAYATQAEYDNTPWPSTEYVIIRIGDYGGVYLLPRG